MSLEAIAGLVAIGAMVLVVALVVVWWMWKSASIKNSIKRAKQPKSANQKLSSQVRAELFVETFGSKKNGRRRNGR